MKETTENGTIKNQTKQKPMTTLVTSPRIFLTIAAEYAAHSLTQHGITKTVCTAHGSLGTFLNDPQEFKASGLEPSWDADWASYISDEISDTVCFTLDELCSGWEQTGISPQEFIERLKDYAEMQGEKLPDPLTHGFAQTITDIRSAIQSYPQIESLANRYLTDSYASDSVGFAYDIMHDPEFLEEVWVRMKK